MLIVSNWKAYVDTREKAKKLFALAKRLASASRRVKLVLAPPSPYLGLLASGNRSKVQFASQDVSDAVSAAVTGEMLPSMVKDLGAAYSLVGHSERRRRGDTNDVVLAKVHRLFAARLTPILCVGEVERDLDARYLSVVKDQLLSVFSTLAPRERLSIIVAYEPVWAIGKSAADAMPPGEVAEMALYIRKVLAPFATGKHATKILYGGSVEPSDIAALAKDGHVDGFLVGHASADSSMYSALVKAVA